MPINVLPLLQSNQNQLAALQQAGQQQAGLLNAMNNQTPQLGGLTSDRTLQLSQPNTGNPIDGLGQLGALFQSQNNDAEKKKRQQDDLNFQREQFNFNKQNAIADRRTKTEDRNIRLQKEKANEAKKTASKKAIAAKVKNMSAKDKLIYFPNAHVNGKFDITALTPDEQAQGLNDARNDRNSRRSNSIQTSAAVNRQALLFSKNLELNQNQANKFLNRISGKLPAFENLSPGFTEKMHSLAAAGDLTGLKIAYNSAVNNKFDSLDGELAKSINKVDFSKYSKSSAAISRVYDKVIQPKVLSTITQLGITNATPESVVELKDEITKSMLASNGKVSNMSIVRNAVESKFISTRVEDSVTGRQLINEHKATPQQFLQDPDGQKQALDLARRLNPSIGQGPALGGAAVEDQIKNAAKLLLNNKYNGIPIVLPDGSTYDPHKAGLVTSTLSNLANTVNDTFTDVRNLF